MKHMIDLTKDNFDRIDFTEAKIVDFFCKKKFPVSFEFSTWGATILLDPHWEHDKSFMPNHTNEDLYVAGIGTIKMNNVLGGNIEVYIYDNVKNEHGHTIIAKNHDGSEVVYRRQWGDKHEFETAYEYLWECVMIWPYGFCNLRLYSNDKVEFEFNTEDTILADDYLKNPQIYTFKE